MISRLFFYSGNMTHNIKKIQSILINCAVLCNKIQFCCGHIFQQVIFKCLSVRISFSWHLADHRRLDGAWRQSNKRNHFHTPFVFLSHSLFATCIFTVKWNYDQRVCGCVLCVLTLVTHQWVEFWSAWSAADWKARQTEGAAGRKGIGRGKRERWQKAKTMYSGASFLK